MGKLGKREWGELGMGREWGIGGGLPLLGEHQGFTNRIADSAIVVGHLLYRV